MTNRDSRAGSRVPSVQLTELRESSVQHVETAELFGGRRVIVFALPGAFTPTCSTLHVPGYLARLKEFREAGVDDIVCLSVNDPYVMDAWQRAEKAEGIRFIADPFGEFTEAMGMSVDHRDQSLGTRSWRYSMLVNDSTIEVMFIEPLSCWPRLRPISLNGRSLALPPPRRRNRNGSRSSHRTSAEGHCARVPTAASLWIIKRKPAAPAVVP